MQGIELRIKGKVQGVGFRPFVWLLANQYKLNGDVNNVFYNNHSRSKDTPVKK